MDPTVIVLWTGYRPGPWACRSLRAAGYRVVGVQPRDGTGGRSVACPRPVRVPSHASDPGAFLRGLEAVCRAESAAAVLPLDEDLVAFLSERGPRVADAVVVGPGPEQFRALCDKWALVGTARRAGVASPASAVVTAEGRDGDWPPLPSVVKPRRAGLTPPGLGGARVAATAAARDAAVRALLEAGQDALVQERVDGEQVSVHCVARGDAWAGVAFAIRATHPRGCGMPSVFGPTPHQEAALDAAQRLLAACGYEGPANLQFLVRDGLLAVHDVNLRPAATIALPMRAGLDLPRMAVDAALGRPWAGAVPRSGLRYVSLVDELKALRAADGAAARAGIGLRLTRAALDRRWVLDPPLRDPLWLASELSAGGRRAARAVAGPAWRGVRRRSRRQRLVK